MSELGVYLLMFAVAQSGSPVPIAGPTEILQAEGSFQNVCHLSTTRRKWLVLRPSYNSSGVLYKGRYVITAAHNVYSPSYVPLNSLRVACGSPYPGNSDHLNIALSDVRIASGYSWTPRRWDRDFAVVRLPSPVASNSPLQLDPYKEQISAPLRLAGFPASSNAADRLDGERMFYGSGGGQVDGDFLRYEIETHTGSSGGPVWVERNGTPYLAGIHVGGDARSNRARLADSAFVIEVERMIDDLEAQATNATPGSRP